MKKVILFFIILFISVQVVNAKELQNIQYEQLRDEQKVQFVDGIWINNVKKREPNYYVRICSSDLNTAEFYYPSGEFAFSTDCDYEFIYQGRLIGYSNKDLKFYEINYDNGIFVKRVLLESEIMELFPEYKIVRISEFSNKTNSIIIKKDLKTLKLILLNDTDREFYNYSFSAGIIKLEKYKLLGFLNVKQKGMIQFSHFGDNDKKNPWFVILVR